MHCAGWTSSCLVMVHLSLAWLLRDAVPGLRRSLLTVQMDDLFLTTGEQQQVEGSLGGLARRSAEGAGRVCPSRRVTSRPWHAHASCFARGRPMSALSPTPLPCTDWDADQYVGNAPSYRLTPQDLAAHVTWQNTISSAFPPGSSFR